MFGLAGTGGEGDPSCTTPGSHIAAVGGAAGHLTSPWHFPLLSNYFQMTSTASDFQTNKHSIDICQMASKYNDL